MIAEVILLIKENRHFIFNKINRVAFSADIKLFIQIIYCSVCYIKLSRQSLLKCLYNKES